ncbi:MAG TPA: hypothetical protein VLX90_22190 [Steroidobacteraceae bacterium]|nr:hypothetical protein [Steroidobacteraceae bacterium]
MPWQECSKVDEKLRFVARVLEGEEMAVLCREFDISRKTGYKIFNRYFFHPEKAVVPLTSTRAV